MAPAARTLLDRQYAFSPRKQTFSQPSAPLRATHQASFACFAALEPPLRDTRQARVSSFDALKPALRAARQASFSSVDARNPPLRDPRQASLSSFGALEPPLRPTGENHKPAQTLTLRRSLRTGAYAGNRRRAGGRPGERGAQPREGRQLCETGKRAHAGERCVAVASHGLPIGEFRDEDERRTRVVMPVRTRRPN